MFESTCIIAQHGQKSTAAKKLTVIGIPPTSRSSATSLSQGRLWVSVILSEAKNLLQPVPSRFFVAYAPQNDIGTFFGIIPFFP